MYRLHVVLDNIRSVFNVGSIFRTADAVGGVKLYLCGITPTPENPKMIKTALGATKSVDWKYFNNTLDAVNKIKEMRIPVFSVELEENAEHFQKVKYPIPVALVFGHERNGVSGLILEKSYKIVYIPMSGVKESLNVATTAGIMMYEVIRND